MILGQLDINFIAIRLEGIEETIISKLIDRAQFCVNNQIYLPGKSGFNGETTHSLFEIRMIQQEQMDARFGRFCAPEERPFTKELPLPQRQVRIPETGLKIESYDCISQVNHILASYLGLISQLCTPGDDGQYGSSVEHDVYAIQAIARRIHFGSLYIAENKYAGDTVGYSKLIKSGNIDAIMEKLTRKEVEEQIIERIREKTIAMQALTNKNVRNLIDPDMIADYYKKWIIPLTKKGEIAYLMNRQDV